MSLRTRAAASLFLFGTLGCGGRERPSVLDGGTYLSFPDVPLYRLTDHPIEIDVPGVDAPAPADIPELEAARGFDAGFPPFTGYRQEVAPPPVSGGTLALSRDGQTLLAADPDRDTLWLQRRATLHVQAIALTPGDEPGRMAEDDRQRAFVVLRRGGALAVIDLARGTLLERRPVCPAPRGIAWDGARRELVVACAGGELISIPEQGAARTTNLGDDLRDVVISNDRRFVTRFRRAELIEVDVDGQVLGAVTPPVMPENLRGPQRTPGVAWRTIAHPQLGLVMLHQLAAESPINLGTQRGGGGAYGGGGARATPCGQSLVTSAVTVFDGLRAMQTNLMLDEATLAVDLAPFGDGVAVAAQGVAGTNNSVHVYHLVGGATTGTCIVGLHLPSSIPPDQVTAVAAVEGGVFAQARSPAAIFVSLGGIGATMLPGAADVRDTGHALFHFTTSAGLACASCHPEGGDDGRVWHFLPLGRRRTPPLRGATTDTAPFHWDGDQVDLSHLVGDVFVRRMSGPAIPPSAVELLAHWIDHLPVPRTRAVSDPDAVARGRALFEGVAACADCHAGAALTNNDTVDVGTGGRFQVPHLRGLAARAPYLHDGRAATLEARLMLGDDDRHGRVRGLTAPQRQDLLRYLESL